MMSKFFTTVVGLGLLVGMIISPCISYAQAVPVQVVSDDPIISDPSEGDKPFNIVVDDSQAVDIVEKIKAYVYTTPPDRESIKLFDKNKAEIVKLKFVKVNLEDDCVAVLDGGWIAICGEFTSPDKEQYLVWFLMQKSTAREEVIVSGTVKNLKPLAQWSVKDVIVKSVDGVPMYKWTKEADGKWTATPARLSESKL